MARYTDPNEHTCFGELKYLVFEDDMNQTPEDFVLKKEHLFPMILRVTSGFLGQGDFTFSSEEMYFVTHVLTQKRVIVRDHFGQMLSFPADHHLKFFTLIDEVKSNESKKLQDIVEREEVILARKTELIPDPREGENLDFNVGPDTCVILKLGIMKFMATYDERYIVGNSVAEDKLFHAPFVIHLWMPIKVDAATGLEDTPYKEYESLLSRLKERSKNFQNSKRPGNKEIMLFRGDIGDYEGVYDIIIPRNRDYGKLPPSRQSSSEPRPDPLPRSHKKDVKQQRKLPKPPPGNTSKKGIFSLFGKKTKSNTKDNQTESGQPTKDSSKYEYVDDTQLDVERIQENTADENYASSINISSRNKPTIPESSGADLSPRSKMGAILNTGLPQTRHSTSSVEDNLYVRTRCTVEYKAKPIGPRGKPVYQICDPVGSQRENRSESVDQKFIQSNQSVHVPLAVPTETISKEATEDCEYVSYRQLPGRLNGLSVNQICDCLKILKMEHYTDKFKEHDIDGDLLEDMDKKDFEDLGFKTFEITKIIKFKNGWRPKSDT